MIGIFQINWWTLPEVQPNAAGKQVIWMRSMESEDQRASAGWPGPAGLCSAQVFSDSDLKKHTVVEEEKDWWLVIGLLKGVGPI